jgi:hypothetical protein
MKGLGWKEAQIHVDFTNNFSIYTYMPKNIYMGPCKCIWQIFTLASCKCVHTLQQDKCKSFTLTLDLHAIYMATGCNIVKRAKKHIGQLEKKLQFCYKYLCGAT